MSSRRGLLLECVLTVAQLYFTKRAVLIAYLVDIVSADKEELMKMSRYNSARINVVEHREIAIRRGILYLPLWQLRLWFIGLSTALFIIIVRNFCRDAGVDLLWDLWGSIVNQEVDTVNTGKEDAK
jgi:hypothetical protein